MNKIEFTIGGYDDAHPPTEPGLYYSETCDQYGNPRPGIMLWEAGKPWEPPSIPTKYWGPMPGAMKHWPILAKGATYVLLDK
jgi:hypothetical protein